MTNTQKTSNAFGTPQGGTSPNGARRSPLRRRVALGAASVVTTGALVGLGLGAGLSSASAAPAQPAPSSSTASSSTHSHGTVESLVRDVRAALFHGSIDGAKAQALARKVSADGRLFSKLPAALRSDLTTLAQASDAQRVADAQKIKSTALNGGYGEAFKRGATALQSTSGYPISTKLEARIKEDVASGRGVGDIGAKIASTVSEDDALFSTLPAALRADITTLAHAPASDRVADVQKIETSALGGGYGMSLQAFAGQLVGTPGVQGRSGD